MPDLAGLQLPPPDNWQDFQRLCRDVWARIWDDPNAQENGRDGQPQAGVDVYGFSKTAGHCGVQCKKKDFFGGGKLTETELRAEVEKAKLFKPGLRTFTIATTSPRDERIQEVARLVMVSRP
jgi:hypothetical protein